MISDALKKILKTYSQAKTEPFTNHEIANFIRKQAAKEIEAYATGLIVRGSAGQSQWASVPWISVFDPLVTTTATKGYYVVYLFASDMSSVSISMNQGTTAVRNEFGRNTHNVLQERAALIRSRVPEYKETFSEPNIDLNSNADLPLDYQAGHAFGKTYNFQEISEHEVVNDLSAMLNLYSSLTYRGGIDMSTDQSGDEIEESLGQITEIKRYRYHKRIERASTAKVKKLKGYVCEACSFDFKAVYGELGKNYIEAHHLFPLSSLEEGQKAAYGPMDDFAVLCANCHRMIHRQDDVSDIAALRAQILIQSK